MVAVFSAAGAVPVSVPLAMGVPTVSGTVAAPSPATAIGGGPVGAARAWVSGLSARGKASGRARRGSEEPAPDDAAAPTPATGSGGERTGRRRRRGETAKDHAHRYEFMDLDEDADCEPDVVASARGGGRSGSPGAAGKGGSTRPGGLTTPAGEGFRNGPTLPVLPSGWVDD